MNLLVINGGTRRDGNTDQLVTLVTEGLNVEEIHLQDLTIKPIVDLRHTTEGFPPISGDFQMLVEKMLAADRLIFATPLYWYGMSGSMKDFLDNWSQALRDTRYSFKDVMATKECYALVVGGNRARITGLPLIQQFEQIMQFTGNHLNGYIIGEAHQPGDIQKDALAVAQAKTYNVMWK